MLVFYHCAQLRKVAVALTFQTRSRRQKETRHGYWTMIAHLCEFLKHLTYVPINALNTMTIFIFSCCKQIISSREGVPTIDVTCDLLLLIIYLVKLWYAVVVPLIDIRLNNIIHNIGTETLIISVNIYSIVSCCA